MMTDKQTDRRTEFPLVDSTHFFLRKKSFRNPSLNLWLLCRFLDVDHYDMINIVGILLIMMMQGKQSVATDGCHSWDNWWCRTAQTWGIIIIIIIIIFIATIIKREIIDQIPHNLILLRLSACSTTVSNF